VNSVLRIFIFPLI